MEVYYNMPSTKYYQLWYSYGSAVGHMLKFYFAKPDATIDEMSPAAQKAWIACHRVVSALPQDEADTIRRFFSHTDRIAQPTSDTFALVDRVRRLVAIERGLADDR